MFIKPYTALPAVPYPSDHLSLVAGFRFKKTEAFTSILPFERAAPSNGAPVEEEDEESRVPILTIYHLPLNDDDMTNAFESGKPRDENDLKSLKCGSVLSMIQLCIVLASKYLQAIVQYEDEFLVMWTCLSG